MTPYTEEAKMGKAIYKILDDKGRITIPLQYRKAAGLLAGDVVRVAKDGNGNGLILTKAEVVDFAAEDPEMMEACIYAAVRTLSREKKLELAASLLSPLSERKGR